MSANVDQRSKGQPNQVSNGANKDVMKESDPYMQPQPHPMRSWSDQTSETAYGAPPMPNTGVSESFFQNFYPPNMTYPFMNQGLSGTEGPWSNGTDTMFGMGYDYNNVYGQFGFPFNNWDYGSDYWGTSQGVRKDQRGYTQDEGYYPSDMIPPDAYGMMNGGAVPPEPQEPVGTVEQGIMGMTISSSNSSVMEPPSRKKVVDVIMPDNFSGGDSSHMMSPTHSQSLQSSSVIYGASQGQTKKTSWAAIASQPARPQQQMRPRSIPPAPVNPNRPHNMDIGTWDGRSNPKAPPPMPQQPSFQSIQPRQTWAASSVRSNSVRQVQPYSTSGPGNDMTGSNPNLNSNNSSSGNTSNQANVGSHFPSYSNYTNNTGVTIAARNISEEDTPTTNGESYQTTAPPPTSHPVLDQLKSSNLYNPKEFTLNSKSARFFIIKSYSEDDIHRSIKYNIWCSTEHGNKRLDTAFREREGKGPVYLIYSVNGSGHFCGIAQMMSPVDYNKSAGVWAQDKWKGQFTVKWVYVKDVPNSQLRHIRLENNENKPVTNSRDTQEVPLEKGKQVLQIVHTYKHTTSIFDDFTHYEKRQEQDATSNLQQRDNRSDGKDHRGGERDQRGGDRGERDNRGGERDHRGGDRGGERDQRGGDREYRGGDREYRGGDRGGDRDNRPGDRDYRGGDRGGDRDQRGGGERDNRGGDRETRGGGDRDRDGFGGRSRENRRGGQGGGGSGRNGRLN